MHEMSNSGDFHLMPPAAHSLPLSGCGDPTVPLLNLSTVQSRMDSLQRFLFSSLTSNTLIPKRQMDLVSTEIASAIQQIIVNGSALLVSTQSRNSCPSQAILDSEVPLREITETPCGDKEASLPKVELVEREDDRSADEWEIIELDAVELLEEHIHFCEFCGKGFKRDANLRMHMRAHGDQFKTIEALAKPGKGERRRKKARFSCPFGGCNRNKQHRNFRPLKSVVCARNHFRRSHCPKTYSCEQCHKKSFSVLSDLKSHSKHCGESSKWRCSCGTTFSRKDKLFGHIQLFEGHMPAVDEEEKGKRLAAPIVEDGEEEEGDSKVIAANCLGNGLFEGWLEGIDPTENYCW